jgi:hypothetical protein
MGCGIGRVAELVDQQCAPIGRQASRLLVGGRDLGTRDVTRRSVDDPPSTRGPTTRPA